MMAIVDRVTGAAKPADRYHHGDLRQAMIDEALDLVRARGVSGFTLAEAAKSVGVSAAAAYRHFADREDLLVAVAVDGYGRLIDRLRTVTTSEPVERLAQLLVAYLRWTVDDHPAFEVMFTAGLEKSRHPALTDAGAQAAMMFRSAADAVKPADPGAAEDLLLNSFALVQGHALLLGDPNTSEATPERFVDLATHGIRALAEATQSR
jgi:AcrR family transcriptional regulator